jgi:hypothetical protein
MPQLFQFPQPTPGPQPQLPQEPPNRPIGQDWLSDAVDGILGGLGIANPFNPGASKAVQLGGVLGAALPFGKVGTLGKAAQDLSDGLTLPHAQNALSETRMGEFMASHGGAQGLQPSLHVPGPLPTRTAEPIAPPQHEIAPRPPGPWDQNTAPVSAKFAFVQPGWGGPDIPMYNIEGGPMHQSSVSADTLRQHGIPVPPMPDPITNILKKYGLGGQ